MQQNMVATSHEDRSPRNPLLGDHAFGNLVQIRRGVRNGKSGGDGIENQNGKGDENRSLHGGGIIKAFLEPRICRNQRESKEHSNGFVIKVLPAAIYIVPVSTLPLSKSRLTSIY